MVDSERSPKNYKILEISVEAIIKVEEMLRFVPDHIKTKNMCKNTVKKLPLIIRYIPDRYKRFILENGGTLRFVPDATRIKTCAIKLLTIMLKH